MSKKKYGARHIRKNMTQEGENMKKNAIVSEATVVPQTAIALKKEDVTLMKKDTVMTKTATVKEDTTMTKTTTTPNNTYGESKFMYINNSQLRINPEIQRKLNPVRVAEIVANFSPKILNPVKVSLHADDNQYYIFDGMHTRAALMAINGGDDFPVFCRVYTGLTREKEAELFAAQFGSSAPVGMIYRLRAMEVAKDPDVLDFLKVTREVGFDINLGSEASPNGAIVAVCAAYKAYTLLGSEEYGRMLTILHRTWAGENWSVNKFMLGGMARFMRMYEIEESDFVRAFREVTHTQITDEVRRFRGMTKDGAYASAIAEIYERGSKTGLRAKKGAGKAAGKAVAKATVKSLNRSRR